MTRNVSIICPLCKELIPVLDKTLAEHGTCAASGMHYAPSPAFRPGPGGPSIQVLGVKACEHGFAVLASVSAPNPSNN